MKIALIVLALVFAAPAFAEDWLVTRVRGEVSQEVGTAWQAVQRGDVIANERHIKTGANGRVGLARGAETIELQGNTQIRIQDAGADRMTSVLQDFGTVSIEAERRNVQHFSVQTRFLAAVVKGTSFTVTVDQSGASVAVDRGVVQVQDTLNDLVVDVRPGQAATVSPEAPLFVKGAGPIAVYNFRGVAVVNGTADEIGTGPSRSGASNAGDNGTGNAVGLDRASRMAPAMAGSSGAGASNADNNNADNNNAAGMGSDNGAAAADTAARAAVNAGSSNANNASVGGNANRPAH